MGQREMRGEGGEVHGAAGMVAVGVVDQEAVARVVDDVVIGIMCVGALVELACIKRPERLHSSRVEAPGRAGPDAREDTHLARLPSRRPKGPRIAGK